MANNHIILAEKTMAAIEQACEADQCASFRVLQGAVLPHIGDAYRGADEGGRTHLGASLLGGECGRAIWYGFRWAVRPSFPGRVLRLFNRGHLEEGRFISLLLMIGCQVYQQDERGNQFRIEYADGHVGGSCDGVLTGLPDLEPGVAALGEFKTHNKKSFDSLLAKGVREAKFEHYVQMQIYMRRLGLAVALYLAVCKDDDRLYGELIMLNETVADEFLERGRAIAFAASAPKRLNESPGFWKCKFCNYKEVCHLGAPVGLNCRTCQFSEPVPNKNWYCNLHRREITNIQREGCSSWERSQGL